MNVDTDSPRPQGMPQFIDQTEEILAWLRARNRVELKSLWKCHDKLVDLNIERLNAMDLRKNLTPAVLSYEGLAFQYMAPAVFEYGQFDYIQERLRILSAFYGVLKPMDGVTPYRLEMQAKASISGNKDLYDLWGDRIYKAVRDESGVIVNLASKEYSKCIEKYLAPEDTYVTCVFGECASGKIVTKGTYAKMARGEMVRYMAEHKTQDVRELKKFDRLNFSYRDDLSSESEFVFERKPQIKQ
ncbi:MAG: Peroxide stress resistance protein YaaA [Bacteroides rodentium]